MSLDNIEPGIYKHKNGNKYEVLMIGYNSNDCDQRLVIYKSLEDSDFPAGTIWVRTLKEFSTPGRFTKE
jgi:hypothetical protein